MLRSGAAALLLGLVNAAPTSVPLSARLIRNHDFVDLRPELATQPYKTAKSWVALDPLLPAAQVAADVARLKREGFAGAWIKFLDRGPRPHSGISWVMQLGSAAAAHAELKVTFDENRKEGKGTFSAFAVTAIPDALGYRTSAGGFVGDNVYFADGPFLYLVGQNWVRTDKHPPKRTGLIAAVQKLYARVHGR